jgi:ribose transport system permease protein
MANQTVSDLSATEMPAVGSATGGTGRRIAAKLSVRNMSAVYVLAALIALFALWVPDTFLTSTTLKTLLNDSAITAIVAVALVIPLAAGVFDLAIGAEVGVTAIFGAWLLTTGGMSVPVAIVLTLLAGGAIGLVSGLLITRVKIDSFIATLGVSSILAAGTTWISNGQQILGLDSSFASLTNNELFGITYPVYYMLVIAAVVWYLLEATPAGRRIYATGGNPESARLSGVRTRTVIVLSFILCGVIAAMAGTLISSNLSTGDPTVGPSYLLPAFSAAFLGSTQFRNGRFNVWGTVIAVYVLAVGVKGLQLAGAPVWIPDLFNGIALLLAVGLARYQGAGRFRAVRSLVSRRAKVAV